MAIQFVTALASGDAAQVAAELGRLIRTQLGDSSPCMVLVFASTAQPLEQLMPKMQQEFPDAVLLASSTAGEFTEQGDAKNSVSACAIAGDLRVQAGFAQDLTGNVETAMQSAIEPLEREIPGYPHRAALLLLDPLTGAGEEATLIAGALLGPDIPLAGGAAGDDLAMKSTKVALGSQVAPNAAVIAILHSKQPFGLGVAHGHVPLSPTLQVTRATGNTVHELDGRPAWDVWAEHTRSSAARRAVNPDTLASEELGGYLLRYEAGLPTGSDYKIRAPLSRDADGSLNFACGIPQGAELRITESEPDHQIDSARQAARLARNALGGGAVEGAIVFDCICRNLILGPRFKDAVHAIQDELGGAALAGFETYGEIALGAGDMSGFHNTTTVVLALGHEV